MNIPPDEAVLIMRHLFKKIAPEFFLNPVDVANEYYKMLGEDTANLVWLALTKYSDKDAEEMRPKWEKWLRDIGEEAVAMFNDSITSV